MSNIKRNTTDDCMILWHNTTCSFYALLTYLTLLKRFQSHQHHSNLFLIILVQFWFSLITGWTKPFQWPHWLHSSHLNAVDLLTPLCQFWPLHKEVRGLRSSVTQQLVIPTVSLHRGCEVVVWLGLACRLLAWMKACRRMCLFMRQKNNNCLMRLYQMLLLTMVSLDKEKKTVLTIPKSLLDQVCFSLKINVSLMCVGFPLGLHGSNILGPFEDLWATVTATSLNSGWYMVRLKMRKISEWWSVFWKHREELLPSPFSVGLSPAQHEQGGKDCRSAHEQKGKQLLWNSNADERVQTVFQNRMAPYPDQIETIKSLHFFQWITKKKQYLRTISRWFRYCVPFPELKMSQSKN